MAKVGSMGRISEGSVLIDSGSWLILDWFLIGSGNVSLFLASLYSVGAHALYGYGRPCPSGGKGVLALPCGPMACWAKGIFCQLGLLIIGPIITSPNKRSEALSP